MCLQSTTSSYTHKERPMAGSMLQELRDSIETAGHGTNKLLTSSAPMI